MSILPALVLKNGHPIATSLAVAADFGKLHKNVIRDIQKLECSEEFRRLNFEPSDYVNKQGKTQPMYEMTRDGFTFLAMGFTGQAAAEWKEKYIAAFNAMEARLRNPQPTGAIALDPARYIELLEAENTLLKKGMPGTLTGAPAKVGKIRFWTTGEIERLKALRHQGLGSQKISQEIGRSFLSVQHMLHRLKAEG